MNSQSMDRFNRTQTIEAKTKNYLRKNRGNKLAANSKTAEKERFHEFITHTQQ